MAKKQATKLSADAINALRNSTFSGNTFTLPDEHLDCYSEIKALMAAIGGKWVSKKKHIAFAPGLDCETLVLAACDKGEIPPSNPLDFFPTQPDTIEDILAQSWLAERWQTRLSVIDDRPLRYCEPNGGSGALVAVMAAKLRPGDELVVIEKNPLLVSLLRSRFPQATVIEGDFLEYADAKPFDVILMNPPFDGKTYQKHVRHAAGMLSRFGILAAIVPSTFINHGDEFLYDILTRGEWHNLGADRFADTNTATTVVFMENDPGSGWREKPCDGYSTHHAWAMAMAIASDADILRELSHADSFNDGVRILLGWASQQLRECSCIRVDDEIAYEVLFNLSDGYEISGLTHLLKQGPTEAAAPAPVETSADVVASVESLPVAVGEQAEFALV